MSSSDQPSDPGPEDLVRLYLKAQNLEQVGRTDEAAELYERAVDAAFDAAGPYDRLIYIYRDAGSHTQVVRVAEAALRHVKTFPEKRGWYQQMLEGGEQAAATQPDRRGAEF